MQIVEQYSIVDSALRAAEDENGFVSKFPFIAAMCVLFYTVKNPDAQDEIFERLNDNSNILIEYDRLVAQDKIAEIESDPEFKELMEMGGEEFSAYRAYKCSVSAAVGELKGLFSNFASKLNGIVTPENMQKIQEFADQWGQNN